MVYFPNGRRDGNTNSLKDPAACIPAFRSQGSGFPVIFDDYPLEGLFSTCQGPLCFHAPCPAGTSVWVLSTHFPSNRESNAILS